MGGAALLDLIGSMVIGGLLLLILFRINDNATANTYNFSGEVTVQEDLVTTIEVLEYDFRKIGYCENPINLPNAAVSILYADTSRIRFLTDQDFNGTPDTMEYYLGPASELTGTPNPNDRKLYRVINGIPTGANLGITHFRISYYNALGQPIATPITTVPTGIQSMEIDIKVESTAAYDEQYGYAFWRQIRLASRNLNNR